MPTPLRPSPVSTHRHALAIGLGAFGRRAASGKVVAGIGIAAAALVGAVIVNTDAVVSAGFKTAIDRTAEAVGPQRVGAGGTAVAGVSGTEEFWLSRAVNGAIRPAAWQGGSATQTGIVGQRFTMSANGVARTLEITEVRSLAAPGDAATAMMLVTCKDLADASAAPVRLVLEPGQSLPGLPTLTAPHSL